MRAICTKTLWKCFLLSLQQVLFKPKDQNIWRFHFDCEVNGWWDFLPLPIPNRRFCNVVLYSVSRICLFMDLFTWNYRADDQAMIYCLRRIFVQIHLEFFICSSTLSNCRRNASNYSIKQESICVLLSLYSINKHFFAMISKRYICTTSYTYKLSYF